MCDLSPAEIAEIAEILFALQIFGRQILKGHFPKENISAISAISAGPKNSEERYSKEPRSQRRNTAPAERETWRTPKGRKLESHTKHLTKGGRCP